MIPAPLALLVLMALAAFPDGPQAPGHPQAPPTADAFRPDPLVEVVNPFEDTHYGTKEMTVRDPDGRSWTLQAPRKD